MMTSLCVCARSCVCVITYTFLDADEAEELIKKNVFLARNQQSFA